MTHQHQHDYAPPAFLPAATHSYLLRAADSLREAMVTTDVGQRYSLAHVAALQTTAAVLAARARPAPATRRRPQRNAWVLLTELAPELTEWAAFFSAGAPKRAAAEAGTRGAVSEREADDLVRDADRFLAVVEVSLGMVRHEALGPELGSAWGSQPGFGRAREAHSA